MSTVKRWIELWKPIRNAARNFVNSKFEILTLELQDEEAASRRSSKWKARAFLAPIKEF